MRLVTEMAVAEPVPMVLATSVPSPHEVMGYVEH
jgi:hypothetical protein